MSQFDQVADPEQSAVNTEYYFTEFDTEAGEVLEPEYLDSQPDAQVVQPETGRFLPPWDSSDFCEYIRSAHREASLAIAAELKLALNQSKLSLYEYRVPMLEAVIEHNQQLPTSFFAELFRVSSGDITSRSPGFIYRDFLIYRFTGKPTVKGKGNSFYWAVCKAVKEDRSHYRSVDEWFNEESLYEPSLNGMPVLQQYREILDFDKRTERRYQAIKSEREQIVAEVADEITQVVEEGIVPILGKLVAALGYLKAQQSLALSEKARERLQKRLALEPEINDFHSPKSTVDYLAILDSIFQ